MELGGRIDFGATYFNPSPEYRASGLSGGGIPPGMFIQTDGRTMTTQRGASPIPVFGLIVPLDSQWAIGLGAYGVAGMGVDYGQNLYGSTSYTSYSQMRFTPGVAYRLNEIVSFGLTLNAMWATMEWNVATAMGEAPHTTSSAFGVGATLGVKVTPIKELSFGAAYETKSFFQDFAFSTPERANPFAGLPGQPATLAGGTDKISFDQPQVVTIGVAARPIDMVLVAADVEWINWAQTNGHNLPSMSQNSSGTQPWDLNWNNQVVLKLGVEVAPLPELRLRAGYNYGKMPLDASRAFENISFPAVAEHHIMGGVGVSVTSSASTWASCSRRRPRCPARTASPRPPWAAPGRASPATRPACPSGPSTPASPTSSDPPHHRPPRWNARFARFRHICRARGLL